MFLWRSLTPTAVAAVAAALTRAKPTERPAEGTSCKAATSVAAEVDASGGIAKN